MSVCFMSRVGECAEASVFECYCGFSACESHRVECHDCRKVICDNCAMRLDQHDESYTSHGLQ